METVNVLTRRVIASLLLRGDRLVKGVAFADFRDAGNPTTTVRALSAQGADEISVLDIDAARERRPPDVAAIRQVAVEKTVPLLVGGGIVTLDHGMACMDAGADKLSVNTAALDRPGLIEVLSRRFGSQAVVVSVDFVEEASEALVYDHRTGKAGPRRLSDWAREAVNHGAGELRLMSVAREGSRRGLALDVLRQIRRQEIVPLVLEGGVGSYQDIADAYAAGADGVGIGTFIVFSDNNIVKIKRSLSGLGQQIRID